MGKNNHRLNELFIGKENIHTEGRTIKHPAVIEHYANIDTNKTRDSLIELIGVDIETNHLTGEMRLLGFYEGNSEDYGPIITKDGKTREYGYRKYFDGDFLTYLMHNVKSAIKNKKHFAHWNKLDAFQYFRLFAINIDNPEVVSIALKRFDHIQGEWNRKEKKWTVKPIIAVNIDGTEFGIMKAIRGSIQFYIKKKGKKDIDVCWSYNIASLYIKGLEKEARFDPENNFYGRFKWYSKVDKTAHLVDWVKFNNDIDYRDNIVLKSNELDCKSAMALGYEVQKDFNEAFGQYPTSLISQGSHARSAVTVQVENDLIEAGFKDEELQEKKYQEISSISLVPHIDRWLDQYDNDMVKDLYLRSTEAYSGGQIDTISYGYAKTGFYIDIASAYPSVIQKLFDLRNSRLERGLGAPPTIENAYIFCRGLVTIPDTLQYHPITIKHPVKVHNANNIRPTGTFYASYTKDERDFCIDNGATFKEESWIAVITEGKLSVLSKVSLKLIDLRNELLKVGSLAEGQVKRIGNSLYGILFEAVPIHEEIEDTLLPEKIGYRAGEFWNSIYACIITSRVRTILSSATTEIAKNGGTPIVLMTDSITWSGKITDMPIVLPLSFGDSGIKEVKTLGYFEKPLKVNDIICFGAGRYGFDIIKEDGSIETVSKKRGMVIKSLINPDKIPLEKGFKWSNFMKMIVHYNSTTIKVITRTLISTGILASSIKYNILDLGRIVEEEAELDLIAGRNKRTISTDRLDPKILATDLVQSTALRLDYNVHIRNGYVDGTLPILRSMVKDKKLVSKKARKREVTKKRQSRYREANNLDINEQKRLKYNFLREAGYPSTEASFKNNFGWDRLKEEVNLRDVIKI